VSARINDKKHQPTFSTGVRVLHNDRPQPDVRKQLVRVEVVNADTFAEFAEHPPAHPAKQIGRNPQAELGKRDPNVQRARVDKVQRTRDTARQTVRPPIDSVLRQSQLATFQSACRNIVEAARATRSSKVAAIRNKCGGRGRWSVI